MQTVEVAFVGTGGIAGLHAASLDPRTRLVAIAEVSDEAREAFARKWSVPRAYPSLSDLLAAEQPDLVHLCTPPGVHHDQAVACLERGIKVLCEKPPALSLSEMDSLATFNGFATVSQHRFGAGAVALRELVAGGDARLGRPMTAVCHTLWYRPDDYFDPPWRGSWEHEGGGPTMGHGIHQMDTMLSILGPWESVVGVAARRARPTATEDVSHAIVTLENGCVVSIVNSLLSPRETSYLRFDFEHATVELTHLYGYGDDNWAVTGDPSLAPLLRGRGSGHSTQFAAVVDALLAGEPLPVTAPDARGTLELIAAIYMSSYLGRPVHRGEIGPDSPFYHRMDGGFGVATSP